MPEKTYSNPLASCLLVLTALVPNVAFSQHFKMPDSVTRAADLPIGRLDSTLPNPTTSFGAVVDDGWVYVIGGYSGPPHDYYLEGQHRDFYRVNLHDRNHIEYLPNDQRLQSCSLEAHDGRIIRIGGMVALNLRGEDPWLASLDTVLAFDPTLEEWHAMTPLPHARSSHDSTMIGSTLVVAGGWAMHPETGESVWHEDVLAMDLNDADPTWEQIPAPFKRRANCATSVGNDLVVIGGIGADRSMSNEVEVLDLSTRTWSKGPEYPGTAFGLAAENVDGRVVASGADGKVYDWAPGEDAWNQVGTLTFPRFFHQIAVASPEDLFFVGGISRGVRPAHIEHLDLAADSSKTTIRQIAIPTPIDSKNRQALFVHDGWIYLFGGNNSTGQHDFEASNFLDQGYRLSLASLQWEALSEYPDHRQTIQTAMHGDGKHVYGIGGFGHDGEVARTWTNGYRYDVRDDIWTDDAPDLPVARSQFGLVEHDGRLWVFGGLDYDPRRPKGDQFRHLTEVLSASPDEGDKQFTYDGIQMTGTRRAFAGAKIDDRYYIIGGMREDFQIVEDCQYFDFNTESFVEIPAPERPRLSAEIAVLDGRIYVAGGSSPTAAGSFEPNRTIEVFDPELNEWSTLIDELPILPTHMRMMPYRGQLLVFSTHVEDADMAHLLFINPDVPSSTTTESVLTHVAE